MIKIDELNEQQKLAVMSTEGPVLVLAGAGSGKTKALTFRIANILDQYKALPNEILSVTFTNKAAKEMKERVSKLLPKSSGNADLFYMGTFHSICVKILRKDGHHLGISPNFVIYDTEDSLGIIKDVFNKLNLSPKEVNPKTVQGFISSAKNELILENEYRSIAAGYFQQIVARIYPEYQRELSKNNAVDFDDLILKVIKLFKDFPEVLAKYQKQIKYVMVDEYQDTNHAQYTLIKMFSDKSKNLCVVGDEDQSIYKFRGSDIRNILNFEKDYPQALIIKLEQNYRSTKNILDAANSVIKHNTQRREKKMWTQNDTGTKIKLYFAKDEKDEGDYIIKNIQGVTSLGVKLYNEEEWQINSKLETVAVLYRTNAQSRSIEEAFIKNGIPYKLVGGTKFYERREIKDILAYLRVIQNPKDNLSLFRIINTPKRQVGKKVLEELEEISEATKCNFGEFLTSSVLASIINENRDDSSTKKSKLNTSNDGKDIYEDAPNARTVQNPILKSITLLFSNFKKVSYKIPVKNLILYVLEKTKYLQYLDDGTEDGKNRIENLQELLTVAERYTNFEPEESLKKFLEDLALIEQEEIKNQEKRDKNDNFSQVTLMSVHASKGLEFDIVFIAGMEEGLFPHSRSLTDSDELEEERRLAYVALTRARKFLHILYAEGRTYFGSKQSNVRSRFIDDLPEDLIELDIYDPSITRYSYEESSWPSKKASSPTTKKKWGYQNKDDSKGTYTREKVFDEWSSWE